jgi:hypothetical protein
MSPIEFLIAEGLISLSDELNPPTWYEVVNRTIATLTGNEGFRVNTFRDYLQQRLFQTCLLAPVPSHAGTGNHASLRGKV